MIACFCPIKSKNNNLVIDAFFIPTNEYLYYYQGLDFSKLYTFIYLFEKVEINIYTIDLFFYIIKNMHKFPPHIEISLNKLF